MPSWKQIENTLGVFVGVALIVGLAWCELRSHPTPAEQNAQRSSETQNLPGNTQIFVAGGAQIHSAASSNDPPHKESEPFKALHHWVTEFLSFKLPETLIAVFTVVLALKTRDLYTATKSLADLAAAQSNETKILQRAYISVEPMGLWPQGVTEMNPLYKIKNAGRLPAQNIRWFGYARLDTDKDATTFKINEADLYGDNILAAEAGMTHGVGAMAINAPFIFVWGIIRYDDGFGKQRFTKFCHRYNTAALQMFSSPNVPIQYFIAAETGRHHGWGNSTDESEAPQPDPSAAAPPVA